MTTDNTPPAGTIKHKLVVPLIIAGTALLAAGLAILINKLTGGSFNHGTMRHLGWFLIPLLCVTGVGCIAQGLELKAKHSRR